VLEMSTGGNQLAATQHTDIRGQICDFVARAFNVFAPSSCKKCIDHGAAVRFKLLAYYVCRCHCLRYLCYRISFPVWDLNDVTHSTFDGICGHSLDAVAG
jgi:hypothetical protein